MRGISVKCSLSIGLGGRLFLGRVGRVLHEGHELLELIGGIFGDLNLHRQDLLRAHGADRLSLKDALHLAIVARHAAAGALRVVLKDEMLAGSSAEGKVVLAAGAVELGLRDVEATGWARREGLCLILGLDWPTGDTLDLGLEQRGDQLAQHVLVLLQLVANRCDARIRASTNSIRGHNTHIKGRPAAEGCGGKDISWAKRWT